MENKYNCRPGYCASRDFYHKTYCCEHMNEEDTMKIDKSMVGKKVRLHWQATERWVEVLYVGEINFFGINETGEETTYVKTDKDIKWELVEEKKLYAPVLYKGIGGDWCLSGPLFKNKQDAQSYFKLKVIWPAPLPDKDGYYEL